MKRWLLLFAFLLTVGAQAQDYPAPIRALAGKGIVIKSTLPAPEGFKGFVGSYQGQKMPIYLLPDGKHVVIGTVFDESGSNLTQAPLQAATRRGLTEATWNDLGKSTWIAEGSTTPRRIVYVFTDTECPYCHKLWLATQPLLVGSDVQVRNIMVAVIAPQSLYRAAAILDSSDPEATLRQHEGSFGHSSVKPAKTVSAATAKRIAANIALMEELAIRGTPAVIYKDGTGQVRMVSGMPPQDRMKTVFGR
ncbi:MAG: thiol:disulfide interchange protein DsbG [Rhodanobacter sp.]|nr:thiol:disulfide interchange protein DsbG [Rhodanobacter sp.]